MPSPPVRLTAALLVVATACGCSHHVRLRVVDEESRKPIADAAATRWASPYDMLLSPVFDAWGPGRTTSDGRIDVAVKGDGTKYHFRVEAKDYESGHGSLWIDADGNPTMVWGASILVIHPRPEGGAWSTIDRRRWTARADAQGVFEVPLVKKTHYSWNGPPATFVPSKP